MLSPLDCRSAPLYRNPSCVRWGHRRQHTSASLTLWHGDEAWLVHSRRSRNDGSLLCGARCAIADRRTKTRTRTTTVDDDDGTRTEPYREFSRPTISELMKNLGHQKTRKRVECAVTIITIPGSPRRPLAKKAATSDGAQAV